MSYKSSKFITVLSGLALTAIISIAALTAPSRVAVPVWAAPPPSSMTASPSVQTGHRLTTGIWEPDSMGNGYMMMTVAQPSDYSGEVVSTVIRREEDCCKTRGVLYIHGYNDYFFQKEMGEIFNDSCFEFYAVDLREYGRSLLEPQTRYEVRNLAEYFADIDSALAQMERAGIEDVVMIGHSTGGLISSYYMAKEPSPSVKALILNSPFLDWNFGWFMKDVAIPAVGFAGRFFPRWEIPQGDEISNYSRSLEKRYNGEWTYDSRLKLERPAPIQAGWVNAISSAQRYLRSHPYSIAVPVLLMHSSKSVYGDGWSDEFKHGDAVLNVDHIDRDGRRLSLDMTVDVFDGGLHDLVLSAPEVREAVYDSMFVFINRLPQFSDCRR